MNFFLFSGPLPKINKPDSLWIMRLPEKTKSLHLLKFCVLEPIAEVRKPRSGTVLAAFKSRTYFCNAEFSQILDPRTGSWELIMRTDLRFESHNWGKSLELKIEEWSHSRGPKIFDSPSWRKFTALFTDQNRRWNVAEVWPLMEVWSIYRKKLSASISTIIKPPNRLLLIDLILLKLIQIHLIFLLILVKLKFVDFIKSTIWWILRNINTVSYTHLTLPTIYSV